MISYIYRLFCKSLLYIHNNWRWCLKHRNMFRKLKRVVVFLKIIVSFVVTRPFGKVLFLRLCPHYSISKTELYKNSRQIGGIWKRRLFVFEWTETFWERSKRWPLDNQKTWFSLNKFSASANQNDQWLFRFKISTSVEGLYLLRFSEWNLRVFKYLLCNVDWASIVVEI